MGTATIAAKVILAENRLAVCLISVEIGLLLSTINAR